MPICSTAKALPPSVPFTVPPGHLQMVSCKLVPHPTTWSPMPQPCQQLPHTVWIRDPTHVSCLPLLPILISGSFRFSSFFMHHLLRLHWVWKPLPFLFHSGSYRNSRSLSAFQECLSFPFPTSLSIYSLKKRGGLSSHHFPQS